MTKNQQLKEWRERLGIYVTEVVRDNIGVYYTSLRRIEPGEIDLEYPTKKMANMVKIIETYYKKREKLRKTI